MYHIALHSRINQIIEIFYRSGLWDREDVSIFRKIGFKLFHITFYISFSLSLGAGAYVNFENDEFIFLASQTVVSVIVIVRMLYICMKKRPILSLLNELGSYSMEDQTEFAHVNGKLNVLMKWTIHFHIMILIGVFFFLCVPFCSTEKRLPIKVWLPFDYHSGEFVYWIGYAFVAIGLFLTYLYTLLTIVLWYLMCNCSLKYELMGNEFERLGLITTEEADEKPNNKRNRITEAKARIQRQFLSLQRLIASTKKNGNIRRTVDHLNSCFSKLFSVQLATSAMCICGSIFDLAFSSHDDLIETTIHCMFLLYVFFDIFMVMYFGNEIELTSGRLSYRLFSSNWFEQSRVYRKHVVILMETLKQPQVLVVCKLYPLNLYTFLRVLNGAYSMFNILQNLK